MTFRMPSLLLIALSLVCAACTVKWEMQDPWTDEPAPADTSDEGQSSRDRPAGAGESLAVGESDPAHTPRKIIDPRPWPVILSAMWVPDAVETDFDELGVERACLITQSAIDPDNTGRWTHPILTRQRLDALTPQDFDGFITLNWEGDAMKVLRQGPSHPDFETTVSDWVRLVEFVRDQRPNAYVGYYSLPVREYWNQTEAWREAAQAYRPILDASTALFPSVYDFYHDKPQRDQERHANVVRLALELADGKPVILYTWHRYHGSNKARGRHLIPREEYVEFISHLMNVEVSGQRPAGVAAWGNDSADTRAALSAGDESSRSRVRQVTSALDEEMRPGEDREAYLDRIARRVFCLLREAVRDVPCEMVPAGSEASDYADGPVTGSGNSN